MILRYLIGSILVLLTMIVQVLFCWFIALFVKRDGNFIWLFKWAQPFDTLAIGDENFWNNEMAHTKDWWWVRRNYWLALQWSGLRNPGWGMMGYMGFKVDNIKDTFCSGGEVDIGDSGYRMGSVYRTCKNNGRKYFDYKRACKWSDSYGWMVQFGWAINDVEHADRGSICRLCIDVRPLIKL